MSIGDRLRKMRKERGMTQSDLGNLLGMTKGAIQKYECGRLKNFKPETVKILSEHFGLPPVYFLYDDMPNMDELNVREMITISLGDQFSTFLEDLKELNLEGTRKVLEYCSDLTLIDKYRKDEGRMRRL